MSSTPPSLIIDTDMSVDVDDVGMLCTAHALVDRGEASLLAVVHNAHLESGVGAISAINHYFGRSHIPLGAYTGPIGAGCCLPAWTHGGRGVYADFLVERFRPPVRSFHSVPPAVLVYRRTLSQAANGSVTIVSVGFLTNLLALLQSAPDEISPLAGTALVRLSGPSRTTQRAHSPLHLRCTP